MNSDEFYERKAVEIAQRFAMKHAGEHSYLPADATWETYIHFKPHAWVVEAIKDCLTDGGVIE